MLADGSCEPKGTRGARVVTSGPLVQLSSSPRPCSPLGGSSIVASRIRANLSTRAVTLSNELRSVDLCSGGRTPTPSCTPGCRTLHQCARELLAGTSCNGRQAGEEVREVLQPSLRVRRSGWTTVRSPSIGPPRRAGIGCLIRCQALSSRWKHGGPLMGSLRGSSTAPAGRLQPWPALAGGRHEGLE